jgi:hypothetical protein
MHYFGAVLLGGVSKSGKGIQYLVVPWIPFNSIESFMETSGGRNKFSYLVENGSSAYNSSMFPRVHTTSKEKESFTINVKICLLWVAG